MLSRMWNYSEVPFETFFVVQFVANSLKRVDWRKKKKLLSSFGLSILEVRCVIDHLSIIHDYR